jgi:hypothetical protein
MGNSSVPMVDWIEVLTPFLLGYSLQANNIVGLRYELCIKYKKSHIALICPRVMYVFWGSYILLSSPKQGFSLGDIGLHTLRLDKDIDISKVGECDMPF